MKAGAAALLLVTLVLAALLVRPVVGLVVRNLSVETPLPRILLAGLALVAHVGVVVLFALATYDAFKAGRAGSPGIEPAALLRARVSVNGVGAAAFMLFVLAVVFGGRRVHHRRAVASAALARNYAAARGYAYADELALAPPWGELGRDRKNLPSSLRVRFIAKRPDGAFVGQVELDVGHGYDTDHRWFHLGVLPLGGSASAPARLVVRRSGAELPGALGEASPVTGAPAVAVATAGSWRASLENLAALPGVGDAVRALDQIWWSPAASIVIVRGRPRVEADIEHVFKILDALPRALRAAG